MDRNTITGLVLIFAIFIGFSLFNSNRLTKAYNHSIEKGDSLYNAGNNELARIEYLKAMKYKPNQPEAIQKLNIVNSKIDPFIENPKADTAAKVEEVVSPGAAIPAPVTDPLAYGAFGQSAGGEKSFITLENSLIKLKISTLGGRVYSAELKEFKTWDGKPLILFDGDSTVFGFRFFTSDNKAVRTNELYFKPSAEQDVFKIGRAHV